MTIRIETETQYARGDGFLSDDFTVIASMSDGSECDVSGAASFDKRDGYLITGDTTIVASYNGATAEYTIEPRGDVLGIMIATEPNRMLYDDENNIISYAGLSVMTLSTSGISKVVAYGDPRLSVSVAQGTTIVNDTEVTIMYMDSFSTRLTLEYGGEAEREVTGISITGYPKTLYESGEALDLTGLTVLGTYSDGSVSVVPNDELTVSPQEGTVLSENTAVTVTYGGYTASFDVVIAGDATVTGFELVVKPAYNGYLTFTEVSEGFDLKGLLVRAIYSDGTERVLGDEDIVYSESSLQGEVTISVDNTAADRYTVYIAYDAISQVLYEEGYATVESLSVVIPPEDTMFTVAEFAGGSAFTGRGLVLYAYYTGGREPEIVKTGDEGLKLYATDNGNGTWTAFAEYRGKAERLGTYEYMPETMDTSLTVIDATGKEITFDNGINAVNMLNESAFSVRLSRDVSGYEAEWYVNSNPYEPTEGENNTCLFMGFVLGGHYRVTAVFTDGTPLGGGSISFDIEITGTS